MMTESVCSAVANHRRNLPARRSATSFRLHFGGTDFTIALDRFGDGTAAELFIDRAKADSDIQATSRDAAIVVSLALQFGCPIETLRRAVTRGGAGMSQSIIGAALDAAGAPI